MCETLTICTIKEVQKLFKPEPSKSTVSNWIHICRDALNKKEHQMLTMTEFCKYFDIQNSKENA